MDKRPETAGSILLYAGIVQFFVVDAHTRRVRERHDAIYQKSTYDESRGIVEDALSMAEPRLIDDFAVLDPGARQFTSRRG